MPEEKVLLDATLCFPVRGNEILLAMKIRKWKIGGGCLNGYGGGIEPEETPKQSIIRELAEEAKIKALPNALEKVAVMYFHNTKTDGITFVCKVHVYLLDQWEGDFQSTDEMINPTWFNKHELPLADMMPADRVWLPVVLAGHKIIGKAEYGPFQKTLLEDVELQYVDSFAD